MNKNKKNMRMNFREKEEANLNMIQAKWEQLWVREENNLQLRMIPNFWEAKEIIFWKDLMKEDLVKTRHKTKEEFKEEISQEMILRWD